MSEVRIIIPEEHKELQELFWLLAKGQKKEIAEIAKDAKKSSVIIEQVSHSMVSTLAFFKVSFERMFKEELDDGFDFFDFFDFFKIIQ